MKEHYHVNAAPKIARVLFEQLQDEKRICYIIIDHRQYIICFIYETESNEQPGQAP